MDFKMNERMIELAKEAAREMNETGTYSEPKFLEKFAELIVKECQTVVEWAISVDSTIDRVPMLIQEHFGVEE
jgi:hypothetical protein